MCVDAQFGCDVLFLQFGYEQCQDGEFMLSQVGCVMFRLRWGV